MHEKFWKVMIALACIVTLLVLCSCEGNVIYDPNEEARPIIKIVKVVPSTYYLLDFHNEVCWIRDGGAGHASTFHPDDCQKLLREYKRAEK
jgi:hypothetical protein